ncbi:cytosine permease [Vibrio chagasii]|nr:cytosine permease [Vibrio chagasii]
MVVGSFVSAGTLTADFVRFGKKPASAVLITMVAFFIGNLVDVHLRCGWCSSNRSSDISDVMIAQGLLLPAIIVLGLNIWTTNENALTHQA